MIERLPAVVDHAHRQDEIELLAVRQLLETRRNHIVLCGRLDQGGSREVLHAEQQRGIDADHATRARVEHLPAEVAVAGADIQHLRIGPVEVVLDPRPLPVRPPLGVDGDVVKLPRALAPGMERLEQGLGGPICSQQRLQRGLPGGVVAVVLGSKTGFEARQPFCPGGNGAPQLAQRFDGGCLRRHVLAISEIQLRQRNHTSTSAKPAAWRRLRCSASVSGTITFSSAVRFCATSSSE